MKKIFTCLAFALFTASAFCTTVTITNSGFTFTPGTVTINAGDSILFSLSSIHKVAEVAQATWNANGATQLPGGFSTALGGGIVVPAFLTVGTHWYVCQPHASMGMKGIIIVQNSSGITENQLSAAISVYPNPVSSNLTVKVGMPGGGTLRLSNALGEILEQRQVNTVACSVDLGNKPKGIYFVTFIDVAGIETVKKVVKM